MQTLLFSPKVAYSIPTTFPCTFTLTQQLVKSKINLFSALDLVQLFSILSILTSYFLGLEHFVQFCMMKPSSAVKFLKVIDIPQWVLPNQLTCGKFPTKAATVSHFYGSVEIHYQNVSCNLYSDQNSATVHSTEVSFYKNSVILLMNSPNLPLMNDIATYWDQLSPFISNAFLLECICSLFLSEIR